VFGEYSKEGFIDKLKETREKITIHEITTLVRTLGAKDIRNYGKDTLIMETICHNKHGGSHKLYYYDSTKSFHCYTECGETFDIFSLVKRNREFESMGQAYQWVCNQLGIDTYTYGFSGSTDLKESIEVTNSYK